jgi:putative phage-type endonuclease
MRLHAPKTFGNGLLIGTYENGSQEWHYARKGGVGGSEIGTLLGLNPWESCYALWAKRSGLIPSLPVQNFAMRLGQVLEEPILNLWQEQNPEWEVFTTGTYQDRDRPYLHANPDALARNTETNEWIVIEVKTSRNYWDQLPPQYEAQVQHYLGILDLDRAVLIGLVGMDWFEQEIKRDNFQIDQQRKAALAFWNHLQTGTRPDWDGSESTYNAVRAENPNIEDVAVEIDGVWEIAQAQEEYDQAKAKLTKIKSQVLDAMGSAKTAYVEHNGERITVVQRQARGEGLPYLVVKKAR